MDEHASESLAMKCWAELRMPARIDSANVGKLLGFAEHDVPILTSAGLLKPLGNPAPNATKWFSAVEIVGLVADRPWLDKATKRISQYWLHKRTKTKATRKTATSEIVGSGASGRHV